MRKIILNMSRIVACAALLITATNVNTYCWFHAHQPKLPTGAEKLKK